MMSVRFLSFIKMPQTGISKLVEIIMIKKKFLNNVAVLYSAAVRLNNYLLFELHENFL